MPLVSARLRAVLHQEPVADGDLQKLIDTLNAGDALLPAKAIARLTTDGKLTIECTLNGCEQGAHTVMSRIAADELGLISMAPAIANAVYKARGKVATQFPIKLGDL